MSVCVGVLVCIGDLLSVQMYMFIGALVLMVCCCVGV